MKTATKTRYLSYRLMYNNLAMNEFDPAFYFEYYFVSKTNQNIKALSQNIIGELNHMIS